MKSIDIGLCLALALMVSACAPPSNPVGSTSDSEREEAPQTTERVVALTTISADLVHRLSPEALVGITGSTITQEDARFAEIPTVSSGRLPPDLEAVVALEPSLVIGAEGFHDAIAQRLQELDIATLMLDVDSWTALNAATDEIATRLSASSEPLLERYQACLDMAPSQEQTVMVLVSRQPILSPNQSSWAGDFLERFNSNNLAAILQSEGEFSGYATVSAEFILQEDPDIILVVDPGNEGVLDEFSNDPFWNQLTATNKGNIYPFEYFGLVNPGSIAQVEATCDRLSEILSD